MSETSQTGSSMAATDAAAAEWGDADHDDDASSKAPICCLQGCLAGTALAFTFMLALPTGIMVLVVASHASEGSSHLLGLGVALVCLPGLALLATVGFCLNQRRIARAWRRAKAKFRVILASVSPSRTASCFSLNKEPRPSPSFTASASNVRDVVTLTNDRTVAAVSNACNNSQGVSVPPIAECDSTLTVKVPTAISVSDVNYCVSADTVTASTAE